MTTENFRTHVTPNDSINSSDIGLVNSQSGATLQTESKGATTEQPNATRSVK